MQDHVESELVTKLFDSHARALALYARQFCCDPYDAVQEAFLKLAEQRRSPRDPVPWLFRVVRNEALMASRSARRRRGREIIASHLKKNWFQPSSDGPRNAEIGDALAKLPSDQREIVIMHIWGGLSFREIGEVSGASDSSAHRRYQAALRELRGALKRADEEQA